MSDYFDEVLKILPLRKFTDIDPELFSIILSNFNSIKEYYWRQKEIIKVLNSDDVEEKIKCMKEKRFDLRQNPEVKEYLEDDEEDYESKMEYVENCNVLYAAVMRIYDEIKRYETSEYSCCPHFLFTQDSCSNPYPYYPDYFLGKDTFGSEFIVYPNSKPAGDKFKYSKINCYLCGNKVSTLATPAKDEYGRDVLEQYECHKKRRGTIFFRGHGNSNYIVGDKVKNFDDYIKYYIFEKLKESDKLKLKDFLNKCRIINDTQTKTDREKFEEIMVIS